MTITYAAPPTPPLAAWVAPLLLVSSAASAQTVAWKVSGDSVGDDFGHAVAPLGDVDGDGAPDLAVGAPGDDNNGSGSGMVRVFSGATGGVLFSFDGDSASDDLGDSVGPAGDVDADGFNDVLAGAPDDDNNGSNSGAVRVYSGLTGGVLHTFSGDAAGDELGFSCGGGADFDQDGFDDLLGGARRADPGGNSAAGIGRVYSGQTGAVLYTLPGDAAGDQAGYSVACAGEVDGDGVPDFMVGIYRHDAAGPDHGSVRIYSGATGATLHTVSGESSSALLGWSIARAGDVDGDGRDDIIAGSPFHSTPSGSVCGRAIVFSGATGGVLFRVDGDHPGDQLGTGVSGGFDVDGDGVSDVTVGADHDSDPANNAGSLALVSGATGEITARFYGDAASQQLGFAVAVLGDLDGDGLADFAGAAPDAGAGEVVAWLGCRGAIEHFGEGCPGSGGFTPRLALDGCPQSLGGVTLSLTDGVGGGSALLLFALDKGAAPVGGGCDLLLAPPLLPLSLTLPLAGGGPGDGAFSFSAPLPAFAAPGSLVVQAFVVDGGAAGGFSATNGVVLRFAP